MQHLPDVVRPIWDVARSIQACLLLVSLSGLNILRQELFRYGFLPHGSKRPKHTVARFIQALTLPPWFIRSYLSPRNYSVMDFFPTAQSCFPTVQTHRCHRWSKHPCSEPPIHILFAPLNVPNAPFLVVLLLFLTLAYFSPSSSPLTPSPILPQYFLRVYTS